MIFKFAYSEPNTVFRKNAFDKSINKVIRINLPDGTQTRGKLLKAEVSQDNRKVHFTIDTDV